MPSKIRVTVKMAMQFSIVADPPGASLHERALKARNELVSKLVSNWQRLAEIQLLYHEPGQTFDRLSQTIHCKLEDHDRYVPNIDDEDIEGDELLLRERLEDLQHERAQAAKQVADTVIQACREAYERHPKARTFEARIMVFARDGNIESATEQKFPSSALGELADNKPPDEFESNVGALDKLVGTIDRLVSNAEAGSEQLRYEKSDLHTRSIELMDKNMGMLDKFKELVEMTLTHAQLPAAHYDLEARKLEMRVESQRTAMIQNTKAAMAHERQQTVQAFIHQNPNFVQDLLATAALLYQQQRGDSPDDATTDAPYDTHCGPSPQGGPSHQPGPSSSNEAPPKEAKVPPLCSGARKLHSVLDAATIAALERNLAPDQWTAISPLFSCTDEGEFRRHINLLSAAISQLPEDDQAQFRTGLRESIPFKAQLRLTQILGSYGLRIY